jgi:small-conductance mechanosensitive channel
VATEVSGLVNESLTQGLLVALGSAALALVVGWLTGVVLRLFARRQRYRWFLIQVDRHCLRAWKTLLFVAALLGSVPPIIDNPHGFHTAAHALVLATICAAAWLVVRLLFVAEDTVSRLFPIDVPNNRRVRRMRTQITLLRRLTASVISVLALGAVLMTFAPLRTFGASLLASAGVVGVIGGLAAQTTLGHVFAGLQLAFTDTLRLEDAVVVEEEWGYIEEIRLTHVVVRLWDQRRLVLPTTYFTSNAFQNWTRNEARVLGSVTLHLDYATPVTALRAEARRIVEHSPFYDQGDISVQVVDTTETTMVVRILASAPDAPNAWDLRCQLREDLLTYLQTHHPESLPVTRAQITTTTRESQQQKDHLATVVR